jgi:hypothetical protein
MFSFANASNFKNTVKIHVSLEMVDGFIFSQNVIKVTTLKLNFNEGLSSSFLPKMSFYKDINIWVNFKWMCLFPDLSTSK